MQPTKADWIRRETDSSDTRRWILAWMIVGLERQMGCDTCTDARKNAVRPDLVENCARCQRLLDEHGQLKQELHYAYWTKDGQIFTFEDTDRLSAEDKQEVLGKLKALQETDNYFK
jgi:hypothetical protein